MYKLPLKLKMLVQITKYLKEIIAEGTITTTTTTKKNTRRNTKQ